MDFAQEQEAIKRRQRIAEMLMQQGMQPLETNQVAGGYVVPVSPLSAIGKVAQQLAGTFLSKRAGEREAKLESDRLAGLSSIDFSAPDAPAKLAAAGFGKEAVALAIQRAKGGSGADPYFTPVETSSGLFKFNARTGEIQPLMEGENRLMRSTSDPNQQAQITAAKEGQKVHKYTDPNDREGFARGQDLVGGPASPPMVTVPSTNGQSQFTGDPSTLNPQERAFLESQGLVMPGQQSAQGQPESSPAVPERNPYMGPSMQEKAALEVETAARKKEAEDLAKASAQAKIDLPKIEENANFMLSNINQLEKHPGLEWAVGTSSILPLIPGTSAADFDARLKQAQGGAFLKAFESLKGGGQITEMEGEKATQAIARLNRAQTEEGFKEALKDLKGVVTTALERSRKTAGIQPPETPKDDKEAARLEARKRYLGQ